MSQISALPLVALLLALPAVLGLVVVYFVARTKFEHHKAQERRYEGFELGPIAGWSLLLNMTIVPMLMTSLTWLLIASEDFEVVSAWWWWFVGAIVLTLPWLVFSGVVFAYFKRKLYEVECASLEANGSEV
ncbi:hypothetical protein [Ruegeria arenilitoris]|uniref:hypothetical protein n=1 Tax=Ruegeria arenilitoris TaxID=1173585 RepID=UPI00147BAF15|nr:hypothetical protein [Ruegeria arenilitoris]